MDQKQPIAQSFEFRLRILGNEIFAVGIATTSATNKWAGIALLSTFIIVATAGAFSDQAVELYRQATRPVDTETVRSPK